MNIDIEIRDLARSCLNGMAENDLGEICTYIISRLRDSVVSQSQIEIYHEILVSFPWLMKGQFVDFGFHI